MIIQLWRLGSSITEEKSITPGHGVVSGLTSSLGYVV
jgi:hypothetical protein